MKSIQLNNILLLDSESVAFKRQKLNEVLSGIIGKILWTNNNPTTAFVAQTITLSDSLNNYNCYEIVFKQGASQQRIKTSGKIPVGIGTSLNWNTAYPKFRPTSEIVNGSSITFEDCRAINAIGSSVLENTSIIPLYVIGYKIGLF